MDGRKEGRREEKGGEGREEGGEERKGWRKGGMGRGDHGQGVNPSYRRWRLTDLSLSPEKKFTPDID